ncbi:MAG: dipeptidase [Saprospiraceae bacterium]|nr:dipeptidase [Saprospiraceae bacterium]
MKRPSLAKFLSIFLFFYSLNVLSGQEAFIPMSDGLMEKAKMLAQKYIIVDGHVDLPYRLRVRNFRLEKEYLGIPIETKDGDFDYVRAKEGGLDSPIMSIYIPSRYQETGGAKELADSLISMVEYIAQEKSDYFGIAHTPDDIIRLKAAGKIALPMGMENGAALEEDLSLIVYFRSRGISYITLTHSKDNKICDSSYDTTRTWKGLSPFGYDVIKEMQKAGVMIDISHVSDSTFYQVLRHTKVPVIASHSSCRKFTPDFERNMSDDMIQRMKGNNGVIMVNFGSSFLDSEVVKHNDKKREELGQLLAERGVTNESDEGKQIVAAFKADNPTLFSDVQKVADHIDHIVQLAGVDHVGFGSDYDGVGDSLPTGLKDVSDYPNLIYELLKRGYSDEDIEKMCYVNVFRVWNEVLDYSYAMMKK